MCAVDFSEKHTRLSFTFFFEKAAPDDGRTSPCESTVRNAFGSFESLSRAAVVGPGFLIDEYALELRHMGRIGDLLETGPLCSIAASRSGRSLLAKGKDGRIHLLGLEGHCLASADSQDTTHR